MEIQKHSVGVLVAMMLAISCDPAQRLSPTPVTQSSGSYLRAYSISSNTWDLDDIDDPASLGSNTGFEAVYESIDNNFGANLSKIEFYATFRVASGLITNEALVKTVNVAAGEGGFAPVPEPSVSDYLRSEPIRVTYAETIAALSTLDTDPDGNSCSGVLPDVCSMVAFPGTMHVGDRIVFRVAITDSLGNRFTVANPQTTVNPKFGNASEANIVPNLNGGLYDSKPMLYTVLLNRTTTTGNSNAYTGQYRMSQVARWQPDLSAAQHFSLQASIDQFVFGSSASDSSQIVEIQKVPGGLPTERQFACKYRGQTITLRINLESAVLNQTGAGVAGALTYIQNPAPGGMGFPASTTNTNLGTVYVPLRNTTVDCTPELEFYHQFPLSGTFVGLNTLPWGLPRTTVPNRGTYRLDRDGLTVGDVFSVAVDDDADEYGRRSGYCNKYTRILLTLTKI